MFRARSIGFKSLLIYVLFLPYDDNYITDWGNGIVTRGDRYVKSGDWAYNCARPHLISKEPKLFPAKNFTTNRFIKIYHHLSPPNRKQTAREFINHIINKERWYEKLTYTKTHINEDSQITTHRFRLISMYNGELWILNVTHADNLNTKRPYSITADLYDARYDKTHAELLKDAKNSCAKPQ